MTETKLYVNDAKMYSPATVLPTGQWTPMVRQTKPKGIESSSRIGSRTLELVLSMSFFPRMVDQNIPRINEVIVSWFALAFVRVVTATT